MRDITVEDVMADPNKYGVPTFQEFAQNPGKWTETLNQKFGRLDNSTQIFKNLVEKQTYKIGKYEVTSLEKIEHIAKEEGIDLLNCKLCPQVVPTTPGKCKIVVGFKNKGFSSILTRFGNFFRK